MAPSAEVTDSPLCCYEDVVNMATHAAWQHYADAFRASIFSTFRKFEREIEKLLSLELS